MTRGNKYLQYRHQKTINNYLVDAKIDQYIVTGVKMWFWIKVVETRGNQNQVKTPKLGTKQPHNICRPIMIQISDKFESKGVSNRRKDWHSQIERKYNISKIEMVIRK